MADGLKNIRDKVMRRLDLSHSPTSRQVAAIDEAVNSALKQMVNDLPFAFFEDEVSFFTLPDIEPGSSTDYLSTPQSDNLGTLRYNPWLLQADQDTLVDWNVKRLWDGRHIDVQDASGSYHRNQIRTIWIYEDDNEDTQYRLSLMKPLPFDTLSNGGAPTFSWRVYTDKYQLPDDIVRISSMKIVSDGVEQEIKIVSKKDAEINGVSDHWTKPAGTPFIAWRNGHSSLPAPNTAPTVALASSDTYPWQGPEPAGKFQYCFSLCWGKRFNDHSNPGIGHWSDQSAELSAEYDPIGSTSATAGIGRYAEPIWESPPSPVSSEVTTVNAVDNGQSGLKGQAVIVGLPNIEYQLGFGLEGDMTSGPFIRYNRGHSGWYYRIYRRRLTADMTAYTLLGTASIGGRRVENLELTNLDIKDEFQLLAEFQVTPENAAQFIDDGSVLPDYLRPLRNINGYTSVSLYPKPDKRYEIQCKVIRRPQDLVSDNDTPTIHSEAIEALLDLSVSIAAKQLKDPGVERAARMDYEEKLRTMRRSYGDLRPESQVVMRRPARVRANYRNTQWWRESTE